jgi:hypothetical protein
MAGDVVARRIELEIHDAPGLVRLALFHRTADVGGDAVGKLQLVENAPHVVAGGRVVGQHVVQRQLGGVVLPLHVIGGFLGLVGVGRGIDFIGGDAERFDRRLGLGQCQPGRREMARYHRVEPVELFEPLQAEPIGRDRQKAKRADQQNGLRRNRQMEEFQYRHGC